MITVANGLIVFAAGAVFGLGESIGKAVYRAISNRILGTPAQRFMADVKKMRGTTTVVVEEREP
jgi:hypothetical protein